MEMQVVVWEFDYFVPCYKKLNGLERLRTMLQRKLYPFGIREALILESNNWFWFRYVISPLGPPLHPLVLFEYSFPMPF